jgi:cell division protein FtsA
VPVRLGLPAHVKGLGDVVRSPIYATGVGLLLYARDNNPQATRGALLGGNVAGVVDRMKSWFKGNF